MNTNEVLKLALEALEHIDSDDNDRDFLFPYQCTMLDKAITAIKQVLAAPVQEPVAWVDGATHYQPHQKAFYKRVSATEWYVWSRVEQEPLHWCKAIGTSDSAHWILRQPAQQEPVEVKQIAEALRQIGLTLVRTSGSFRVMDLSRIEAQTTSPPAQRQPLTDEQFNLLVMEHLGPHALTGGKMSVYDAFLKAVRATEAAHGITGSKT